MRPPNSMCRLMSLLAVLMFCLGCGAEDDGGTADGGTTDEGSADRGTGGDTPRAMITIHIDPDGPNQTNATAENWDRLAALVAAADAHGHKLTLLMSASWVDVASDPARQADLKNWIENGHQLGFHHHTCGHSSPDGYRDVMGERCKNAADLGSVAVAFAKVRDLATAMNLPTAPNSNVDTAAQGPNPNGIYRAAEWQPEAIYATGEMSDNADGHSNHRFITLPRCATGYGNNYGGVSASYQVPEMGHAQLDVGSFTKIKSQNNLTALEADVDLVLGEEHANMGVQIGVVFHAREYTAKPRNAEGDNYDDDKAYLNAVFQLFVDKGVPVVTVREILTSANPCAL